MIRKRAVCLLPVLAGLIACEAAIPEGRLFCEEDEACPPGWYCHSNSRCYSRVESPDGGGIDAALDADADDADRHVDAKTDSPAPNDSGAPDATHDAAPDADGVDGARDAAVDALVDSTSDVLIDAASDTPPDSTYADTRVDGVAPDATTDAADGSEPPDAGVDVVCECSFGATDPDEVVCGNCGTQSRSRACSGGCAWDSWSDWSSCGGQRSCEAGVEEFANCGNCVLGSARRVCDLDCEWGDWSGCTDGGACAPGDPLIETRSCGSCGGPDEYRTGVCDAECARGGWSTWSGCGGSGLLAYWPMDGNGNDVSGASRDLTLVGGPVFAAGTRDQALVLPNGPYAARDAVDSIFDFGDRDFTIQLWVMFNTIAGEQVLIEKLDGSNGPGWTLTKIDAVVEGNVFHVHLDDAHRWFAGNVVVTTGAWHHVVLRRDVNSVDVFFDGAMIMSGALADAFVIGPAGSTLRVGARGGGSTPMNGAVDEVAIWDRALADSEIAALLAAGGGVEVCTPDGGGAWTQVLAWDRHTGGDSLAELTAAFTSVESTMNVIDEQTGYVRWCDNDARSTTDGLGDVARYVLDVSSLGAREVTWDVRYQGVNIYGSAMWLSAVGSSARSDVSCHNGLSGFDLTQLYGGADAALIPSLSGCSTDMNPSAVEQGTNALGQTIHTIELGFAHHQGSCDDHSELYSLSVWVGFR